MSVRIMDGNTLGPNSVSAVLKGPGGGSTITADCAAFALMLGARILQTAILLWPVWGFH